MAQTVVTAGFSKATSSYNLSKPNLLSSVTTTVTVVSYYIGTL